MSGIWTPGGGLPPISVINKNSSGNYGISTPTQFSILSGALSSDTYSTILEITSGGGVIQSLAVLGADATNRTITAKVTIDGNEVRELAGTISNTNAGVIVFGSIDGGAALLDTACVPWFSSLKIEVKSTLTETDKVKLLTTYYLV